MHQKADDSSTEDSHSHQHGHVDPEIARTSRGMWAVKISFFVLIITSVVQGAIFWYSASVGLLADMIHNVADATTAIPLYVAFWLKRDSKSRRFTYGLGRVEDLAGLFIVVIVFLSGAIAGWESIKRMFTDVPVTNLWTVIIASMIGFFGNEGVAWYRIHVGREIGSAALVADGQHSRADGLASLAVALGISLVGLGRYLEFELLELADPIVGLLISLWIFHIAYDAGKTVFMRLLDGVNPKVIDGIEEAASATKGVRGVNEIRARWNGHDLLAEVNIAVDDGLTVQEGHEIAKQVQEKINESVDFLENATIHVDPESEPGERHHVP